MTKWTVNDIKKTGLGNNLHENGNKKHVSENIIKKARQKVSIEKQTIKTLLWVLRREGKIPEYTEELEFSDTRKFRFDWAIPGLMLAIEYEGIFSKKSRHTTVGGFTEDCEKYNLAQNLGWTVLRYTAKNYGNLSRDIENFIKKRKQ